MGHPEAIAYLASPAVVAASAAKGVICGPDSLNFDALPQMEKPTTQIQTEAYVTNHATDDITLEPVIDGFPEYFEGPLVFAPQDNLTTDGMYPGKYTYQDDITPEKQAEIVMENYDPSFAAKMRELRFRLRTSSSPASGPILFSGYNFGTGSSREQAATAMKHAGIPVVVCGSFGDIYKRNSINNGLILVEAPQMIEALTEMLCKDGKRGNGGHDGELTVIPDDWLVKVDVRRGIVSIAMGGDSEQSFPSARVGRSVQELWVKGGLEGFIRASL